jgi:hypothetical protein
MSTTPRIDSPEALFGKLERTFMRRPGYVDDQLDWVFDFAVTAWHLVDWVAKTNGSDLRTLQDSFVLRCAELGVCAQIANGSKHLLLSDPRLVPFNVSKDVQQTTDLVGVSGILIPDGPPVDVILTPEVAITDRNGVQWAALETFHKVIWFWRNELSITTPPIAP